MSTALQWLVANNPYYSHVTIDEEALQALEKGGGIHHFGKEEDEGEVDEAAQEIVAAADPLLAGLKHYPAVTDGDCFFDGLRGANPDIQDLRKKVGKYVDQDTFEQYELLHNTSLADLEEARGKLQDHLSTRTAGRPTKKWLSEKEKRMDAEEEKRRLHGEFKFFSDPTLAKDVEDLRERMLSKTYYADQFSIEAIQREE